MRPVWAVKAMFVIVFASILFRCVCGANHTVGGASGWDLSSDMQDWASTETFNVGDDLVFSYTPLYDVIEVNQQGYNTCTIANAISTHNTGETVIHLTESGTRYFVCGRMGHCQQGLKLEVKVQAQSNNTGTSPTPSSPPRPHSPPSPPDGDSPPSPPHRDSPPSPPDAHAQEPCASSCADEGHSVVPLITLVIILAFTWSSLFFTFSHVLVYT